MGSGWGGTDVWVRGQGEAIAKGIWYQHRWKEASTISIDWAGMTADEKEDNRVWCAAFIEKSSKPVKEEESRMDLSDITKAEMQMQKLLDKKRAECRGGCGVKDATKVCSQCKEVCKLFSHFGLICLCIRFIPFP